MVVLARQVCIASPVSSDNPPHPILISKTFISQLRMDLLVCLSVCMSVRCNENPLVAVGTTAPWLHSPWAESHVNGSQKVVMAAIPVQLPEC